MSVPKFDPNFTAGQLQEAADRFMTAAHEYWIAAHKAGVHGAVIWAEGQDGLAVFTRGEYRETILRNIHELGQTVRILGGVGDDPEITPSSHASLERTGRE